MHYQTHADDYPGDLTIPAVKDVLDMAVNQHLLKPTGGVPAYAPTEGTKMFVDALSLVPLPKLKWVMP